MGCARRGPTPPQAPQHAVDGTLELTVSTHPEGRVSRHLRDRARPGMIVGLSEAQGEFVLPRARPERVLLISGGSGITPVMAMLRTLCDEGLADTGESWLPQLRALPRAGSLRRRARRAGRSPRAAASRTRLHARRGVPPRRGQAGASTGAAQRTLPARASARGHRRALRRRHLRVRSAGADRRGRARSGRRTACPSRRSRRSRQPC